MAMHHVRGKFGDDGCNFICLRPTGQKHMMDGVYCYNFDDGRLVK